MDANKLKQAFNTVNEVINDEELTIRFMYTLQKFDGDKVEELFDVLDKEFTGKNLSNNQVIEALYKIYYLE